MSGAFITVEGGEGVGKSTCMATIEAFINAAGFQTVASREPGGTALGEQIREWILNGQHGALTAEVETLLMFAARAEHLEQKIRPALAAGQWVICDRFTDATFAYQGAGRGAPSDFLINLTDAIQGESKPDLTLLLDAPVGVGLERISHRRHDHFEREGDEFFSRVRNAYLEIAAREPQRVKVIDATTNLETVQQQIETRLAHFLAEYEAGQ